MTIARPVVALAAIAALLTSCGDGADHADDGIGAASTGRPEQTGIVATAADGTEVEFEDFTVMWRPSEDDQPEAQIVRATSGWGFAAGRPTEPAMLIEAADTTGGQTLDLPHGETWGAEKTFLIGFITQVGKDTELSSAEEQATGEIEVISASCDPEPHLEVRIDGTFESEVSDATVTVKGYVSAD